MSKIKCDCCRVEVALSLGQYIESIHEFICDYCLEELFSSGPEDIHSYEIN
jgi:hypothetical protein